MRESRSGALLEDVVDGRLWSEQIFRDQQDLLANDDEWLMSLFRLALQRSIKQEPSCVAAVLHTVTQLKNVPHPLDMDAGPDSDLCPRAFEPNAAATRQRLDAMHRL
ncbi:hypothetical protein ABVT39_017734 [Epinephelus coioides]